MPPFTRLHLPDALFAELIEHARTDAPLEGEIEVSADIAVSQIAAVQRSLGDAGATRVSGR